MYTFWFTIDGGDGKARACTIIADDLEEAEAALKRKYRRLNIVSYELQGKRLRPNR